MSDAVLPELEQDEHTKDLPADPRNLLTDDEQRQMADDLAKLARLRRDAEQASENLRLA